MNLGVFNRVNLKDSTEGKGMYSEWASLSPLIQNGNDDSHSVLDKFGMGIGKDVALGIVKQLSSNLGITQAAEPSPLNTDREVQWCMEVLCFGLTLPLSEHDTIKDCVNVYCEWLSALLPIPKICVPKPVCEDPNLYARKIIGHFHNLFVPRKGEGVDTINRQAVLCHRVLRTLQQLAHESLILSRETWESLLLFLLAINDTLLSPPTVRDDVADQLCERVLSVLFEVWLIACAKCFPSPPLWKTLRESCMNWRHRIALIEQWNRINLALTARLLEFMYGPTFPELKIGEEDLIPPGISNDCIAQSWFRFLHCLGNPVSLCRPEIISQTPKFLQFAITSEAVMDPCQHPCLQMLPMIFLKAIKGIAGQVDAFLGIAQTYHWEDVVTSGDKKDKDLSGMHNIQSHSPTPPPQRRLAKSFSVAPSSSTSKGIPKASLIGLTSSRVSSIQPSSISSSGPSSTSSLTSMTSLSNVECRSPLAQARPKCNSILHLFGEWLFEAAFIGCENAFRSRSRLGSDANKQRPNSIIVDNAKGSLNISQPGSLNETAELPINLTIDKYEAGRAEAIGALCRVFCAKKTGEEILPVYLARFYLALQQGLKIPSNRECNETLISILLNSSDLFRLDLDGVQVLIPSVIAALEIVLPEKDLKLKSNVSKTELRRASIHLLLSMLVLPLHFQNLSIRELVNTGGEKKEVNFAQLKPRLMNLLMNALQVESDPHNTHMLLGGLLLCVQDSATLEMVEQVAQPDCTADTSSNLLSSVSDTASMGSASANASATTSNMDFPSLPDEIAQGFSDMQTQVPGDNAHALFVRATYLVCHRLISSWKTDLNESLAALELLSGLARVHIRESDAMECKRTVKWLCDYIVAQCSKPPPAHSKDLHSTIVAAFQCCAIWLLEHPYLLQDKECLNIVLEVVELGVSGTKSVGKPGEKIRLKDAKDLKPASMRVRDAAENLLTCIMEQVGYFPSECGAESLSSLLDEVSLLKHCNSWPADCTDRQTAVERFRYFVAEGSIMLALLEEPLGNDQDPQPTITVLIRGPFGRHAWTMQLRHLPRHRSGTKYHAPNPGRPVPMQDMPVRSEIRQKYFPDSVERIPQCKVDQSIPNLETVTSLDSTVAEETNKLAQLLERQTISEKNISSTNDQEGPNECTPPPVSHEYQTARLFLSHFGFLRFDKDKENSTTPSLIALDSSASDFCKDLAALDSMSSRTCDTVHIFYVRAEQHTANEILSNVYNESSVCPQFLDFLLTLGWPVNVSHHAGWTGHTSTSWKTTSNNHTNYNIDHGGSLFDGQSQVLYWADACTEVAFVVPSQLRKLESESLSFNSSYIHTSWYNQPPQNENLTKEKPRTLSLDFDKNPVSSSTSSLASSSSTRRSTTRHQPHPQTNTKIMVVWLESYEDHLQFPLSDVLPCTNTGLETAPPRPGDCFIIFLHKLNSDLLRVHLQGPSGRMNLATPLIDGMVVSRRSLGPLVRQTCLNMSRRRRLDNDTYQPPHVRRRLKVQEVVQKYKREMTESELLTYLFSNL